MPDLPEHVLDLASLGMAIDALREHHASLGPLKGHAAQTAKHIEAVKYNFDRAMSSADMHQPDYGSEPMTGEEATDPTTTSTPNTGDITP